jgi:hypothetical protein
VSEEESEPTTWIPIAIAGVLVAAILALVFLVDGKTDETPGEVPSSPVSSTTP